MFEWSTYPPHNHLQNWNYRFFVVQGPHSIMAQDILVTIAIYISWEPIYYLHFQIYIFEHLWEHTWMSMRQSL